MRAAVLTLRNPFDPLSGRELRLLRRPRRVGALAPRGVPVVAVLNGRPLMRTGWRRRLRDGEHLVFVVLPRGGGGGSNPLRVVLSLALLVFAPALAGGLLGAVGLGGAAGNVIFGGFTVGMATQLGVELDGQALINAQMPASTRPAAQLEAPSPTYTLAAQGNAARIEQPVPVQYGRMLSYPDFASQPYTQFEGGEQYLYQLLCLGAGAYEIEEIRIEDTPVESFPEITVQVVPPGGQVTLFPTAVTTSVEVSGQEMTGGKLGTYVWSGATVTVTQTAHGRAPGQPVYLQFTSGTAPTGGYAITGVTTNTFTVTVGSSGSSSGNVSIQVLLGGPTGFVAAPAGTLTYHLSVDVVLPRGLYGLDGDGELTTLSAIVQFQAQAIDDAGDPLGAWFTIGTHTITDRTATPIRRSFWYDTSGYPGRFRVRAFRADGRVDQPEWGHDVSWTALRAYLGAPTSFPNVTLIAMRMRATNSLSLQASRRIAVLATRKLPVWNGTSWSEPVPTRSIAWAIADAARHLAYGARLPASRIDLAALLALDAEWTARGDTFNARFDQAGTWWEAVTRIAAAGRAMPFMQGGRLRVVRDGPAAMPVALFSMRNIRAGSFALDYLMPSDDTADAVDVSYWDQATWSQRRVMARLPDSLAARPVKDEMFGVTDRAQAYREGMFRAACNRYRRRIVTFATEMEGFIPSLGDTIAIQHDVPGWAVSAEAIRWVPETRRLRLSEPVSFGAGAHYVGLRKRDGSLSGPWQVWRQEDPHVVRLAQAPDFTPYTGSEEERTHVVFGPGAAWSCTAKVRSVTPRGLYEVQIVAVPDDPSVHSAEAGIIAPPRALSSLPRRIVRPLVAGLSVHAVPGDATRAVLAWEAAAGADTYQVEMAQGDDPADGDVSWTRVGDTAATNFVVTLLYATRTMLRVRALGLVAGPWAATTAGSLVPAFWYGDDTDPFWTGADSDPFWS
jgi:hypothetical protein